MAHRTILTARQRAALFDLPTDEASILYHYTLSDDDLEHINVRRRSENRFGYALQLCALRHPGRLLSSREVIPEPVVRFVGAQLGMTGDEILPYAARRQTRQQHLHDLRQLHGFKMFSGHRARELKAWCRVAFNWALPQSVWRTILRTGRFRRDSDDFKEALVARERCFRSKR